MVRGANRVHVDALEGEPAVGEYDVFPGIQNPEAAAASVAAGLPLPLQLEAISGSSTSSLEQNHVHYVDVSDREFRAWWWCIFLYHFLTIVFTVIAGGAHVFLGDINVYENMWLLAIPRELLVVTGWSYLVVMVGHILAIVSCVGRSLYHCRLTFGYERNDDTAIVPERPLLRRMSVFRPREMKQQLRVVVATVIRGSLTSVLAINGKYFEDGLHMKQLVEVGLQSYQARTLSRSVPNRRLNGLVVGLVLTNCLYTPVVDYVFRKQTGRRRLASLTIDVAVDFAIAVIVPIWVLIPMLKQFDWIVGRFPSNLTYNDVWVANSISDGRQALVTSHMDYISSLFPHVLGLLSMDVIKSMLRRQQFRYNTLKSIDAPASPVLSSLKQPSAHPTTSTGLPKQQRNQALASFFLSRIPKGSRVSYVVDRLLLIWAITVLTLHIGTESRLDATLEGCAVHANAWLPAGYPCSVFQVNCHRVGSAGASQDMTQILQQLDQVTLTKLIFSHCPALEVPPLVTEFSSLRSIETFNCTIARWDETAAVTQSKMPMLVQVQLVLTNISTPEELPTGFYHDSTPAGLNIVMHGSNLSALPEDIGRVWRTHRWGALWFEMTQLKTLPLSFREITVTKISLLGGQIERLDDDLFKLHSPAWLRVSDNPLQAFPREFYDVQHLSQLFAERTNVTELSPWLEQWWASGPKKTVHGNPILLLRGSSFCKDSTRNTSSDVFCADIDPRVRGDVRLDLLSEQRPL